MGDTSHCPNHDRNDLLDEAIKTILSTVDLGAVVRGTGRLLRTYFGAARVTLHGWSAADPGRIEVLLVDDPRGPVPDAGSRHPVAGSASGVALTERRPFLLDHLATAKPRYREERPLALAGFHALLSIPLIFEDQVLGTLDIAHPPPDLPAECCRRDAERIAALVAVALHNTLMVDEVRRLNRLLDRENAELKARIREVRLERRYVVESPPMKEVVDQVRRVAASDATVLLRGETGTGKEGLARLVHEYSPRFAGPYVVVNLGAIPENLIESELFGHERGAFTGADRARMGRFEQASGGTLFLDEVGDAPLPVQVKLLRALQEREIQPVGGSRTLPVDVRVVAATNRDLESLVRSGAFRSDLYYRLSTFPVHVPPLRERRQDIRPLVGHFLERHAASMGRLPPGIPEDTWRALEAFDWPGNVRELENFVERALILSPGPELVLRELPGGAHVVTPPPREAPAPEVQRFDEAMRDLLRRALAAAGGRVYGPGGAAAMLGIKPTTLQGKMKRFKV